MAVKISLCEKIPKNAVIIEAFPSKGYVSSIASSYLIKEAGFRQIGSVECAELANFVVVHDGEIQRPIRFYGKDDIVIIFSEIIIPPALVEEFVEEFEKWILEVGPREIIMLTSLLDAENEEEHKIMGVATTPELKMRLKDLGVEPLMEGVLTGLSSTMILDCAEHKVPATTLIVRTKYVPDALAAASLLNVLEKMIGVKVDVKKLRETGRVFERQFQSLLEQLKKNEQEPPIGKIEDEVMYR